MDKKGEIEMKSFKKLLTLLFVLMLAFALTACGDEDDSGEDDDDDGGEDDDEEESLSFSGLGRGLRKK